MTDKTAIPARTLTALRDAAGDDALRETQPHELTEPRDLFQGHSRWLCLPADTACVQRVVQVCNDHALPIVPHGGGTGLVGGQTDTAERPSLLLSTRRINALRAFNATDATMVCEAGMTLADAQSHASEHALLYPLSLASEGSCTVGGTLATNAGGINVLRYGSARALCLGVEAVLADGTLLRDLNGLRKDNTGYAVSDLLVGSEGTLGIITAACLRLFPAPRERATLLAAVPDPASALRVLSRLQHRFGERVSAFELIARQGVDFLVETRLQHRMPLAHPGPWYVLTEIASGEDPGLQSAIEDVLSNAFEAGDIEDAVLASSESQRQAMWHVRETIPEANRLVGSVASFDISVPVSRIPDFIKAGTAALGALDHRLRINCFGHLGDGNLHFNVFPPAGASKADFKPLNETVKSTVYGLVQAHDGSFSAEHGVGRQKTSQLSHFADPGKLQVIRTIKRALDPQNLLNPGAIVPE